MIIKGLQKGDKKLRKFTFNDEEYIEKNGKYYYKVNYGKNNLEGEYAEDEIDYIEVTQVIPLGGRKLKPIPELQKPEPVQVVNTEDKPKRGRPPKVKTLEVSNQTIPVAPQDGIPKFEYYVSELTFTNSTNLQELLNKLGEEGWELCGFEGSRNMFASTHIVAVFKRRRG